MAAESSSAQGASTNDLTKSSGLSNIQDNQLKLMPQELPNLAGVATDKAKYRKLPEHCKYYVYAFVRDSGIPYYIGRGCRYRAWDSAGRTIKPPMNKSKIKIVKDMLSFQEASDLEKALIYFWGRKNSEYPGVLANLQEGGSGGSPGRVITEQHRQKLRQAKLGKKQSKDVVAKRLAWLKARGPKMERAHLEALTEAIKARHRVWWHHEALDIEFYGTAVEVSEKFSHLFYGKLFGGKSSFRIGAKLCRTMLRKAWCGKILHYRGWTRGQEPGTMT